MRMTQAYIILRGLGTQGFKTLAIKSHKIPGWWSVVKRKPASYDMIIQGALFLTLSVELELEQKMQILEDSLNTPSPQESEQMSLKI